MKSTIERTEEAPKTDGKLRRVPVPRRRRSRNARVALITVIGIALGVVGASGIGLLAVKSQADGIQSQLTADLKSGQTYLESAKTSLKLANNNHDPKQIDAATNDFVAAKAKFAAAVHLADGSTFLHGLEVMPAVGGLVRSRHDAVDGLGAMGIALSEAGLEVAKLDAQLIKPAPGGQPGQLLLGVLKQAGPSLVTIRAELQQAQVAAQSVDVSVVPAAQRATFVKARDSITTALGDLDELRRLMPILIEILGGNGPRTYLIEQVNPAELRGGGGFLGSFSLMSADNGSMTLVRSGNSYELASGRTTPGRPGYVTPPGPLLDWLPRVGWSFVDSNFFPDFPANARAAIQFVQPQLKSPIDAVISMDYYTVAGMLKVTGPLDVPGYPGVTLTADNFVPLLIKYDLEQGYTHKAILSAIAGPLLHRLLTIPTGQYPALISTLTDIIAHRHLQVYFTNPDVRAEMDRFGWSGVLNPTHATDYMMEVECNLGGTKANYYVKRTYTVRLSHVGNMLHHVVTVDIYDNMPVTPGTGNTYHGYFRLFVSPDSSGRSDNLVPVKNAAPPPPDGLRVLDGWLPTVRGAGGHGEAVFQYDTPWQTDNQGVDHIYWQKQPGTLNDAIHVIWQSSFRAVYTAGGDLSQDRVIDLAPNGVSISTGEPAQAQLPSLSLG